MTLLAIANENTVPVWEPSEIKGLEQQKRDALLQLKTEVVSLQKFGERIKWTLADILLWCRERDLDSEIFDGFTESELANLYYLSLYPPVMRTLELSPSHYRVLGSVARDAVNFQNQGREVEADKLWTTIERWLNKAIQERWGANELREQIKANTRLVSSRGQRPTSANLDFTVAGNSAVLLMSPDKITVGTWQAGLFELAQQIVDVRPGDQDELTLSLETEMGERWEVLMWKVESDE